MRTKIMAMVAMAAIAGCGQQQPAAPPPQDRPGRAALMISARRTPIPNRWWTACRPGRRRSDCRRRSERHAGRSPERACAILIITPGNWRQTPRASMACQIYTRLQPQPGIAGNFSCGGNLCRSAPAMTVQRRGPRRQADSRALGADVENDDYPIVGFTPQADGVYSVRIVLQTCTVAPCYVAARLVHLP